jgi:hypothetical protein
MRRNLVADNFIVINLWNLLVSGPSFKSSVRHQSDMMKLTEISLNISGTGTTTEEITAVLTT